MVAPVRDLILEDGKTDIVDLPRLKDPVVGIAGIEFALQFQGPPAVFPHAVGLNIRHATTWLLEYRMGQDIALFKRRCGIEWDSVVPYDQWKFLEHLAQIFL